MVARLSQLVEEACSSQARAQKPPRACPLFDEVPTHDCVVPGAENRRRDADGEILLRFPKAVHAGAEAGESDFGAGVIFRKPGMITSS
jgi:hypothetical protein